MNRALRMEFESLSLPVAERKCNLGTLASEVGIKWGEICTASGDDSCRISHAFRDLWSLSRSAAGRRPTLPFHVKMFAFCNLRFGNIGGQSGKCLLGLRLIGFHSSANGLIRAPGSGTVGRFSGIVSGYCRIKETRSSFVTDSQIEREGSYRQ